MSGCSLPETWGGRGTAACTLREGHPFPRRWSAPWGPQTPPLHAGPTPGGDKCSRRGTSRVPLPGAGVLIQLPRLRVQGTVRHTNSQCEAASQAESLTVGPGALPRCPGLPSAPGPPMHLTL